VLYGMRFQTRVTPEDTAASELLASRLVRENEKLTTEMCARLPKNRELLTKIREYGLQSV